MRLLHRAVVRFAVLGLALAISAAAAPARVVGFQWATAGDADGAPLPLGIWYPSAAPARAQAFGPFTQQVAVDGPIAGERLPLIVLSHGTGGSLFNAFDTAQALARAGFVVVAPTHAGDNYQNHAAAFTRGNFADRPRQVSRVIDHMLTGWPGRAAIDPRRIGLVGHSAGGTTALIAIGGRLNWRRVIAFCHAHPQDWGCRNAQRQNGAAGPLPEGETDAAAIAAADPRIKAAVVAAPALTHGFAPDGLAGIRVPVQLWVAGRDEVVPDAATARSLLPPGTTDTHRVAKAGHFAFLAPCSEILASRAPEICRDPTGFDRAAFLRVFQRQTVAFFKRTLGR